MTAVPGKAPANDGSPVEPVISKGGAPVPAVTPGAWKSWPDAKKACAGMYRPQPASLARRAAPSWQIEHPVPKFGEGIREGQKLTVPLLKRGTVQLVGDGANAVRMTLLERDPPAEVPQGVACGGQSEATFGLDIACEDGTQERLSFFVVPKGAPSKNRSGFPHS